MTKSVRYQSCLLASLDTQGPQMLEVEDGDGASIMETVWSSDRDGADDSGSGSGRMHGEGKMKSSMATTRN
eukprot:scaffold12808_cov76-Skeletonema_dohrnii-CCMP3373.AAC.3